MPPSPTKKKLYAFLALAVLIGVGLTAWISRNANNSDVPLATVARGDLVQRVTVAGIVVPNRKTLFSPAFNSYVKKIYVRIGDKVKEGDPVVSFVENLRNSAAPVYPLRSPYAGTVVQIPRTEGEFVDIAKDNNVVVRVDDLSHLFVLCDVPEGDIGKLKLGQEVIIKANGVLTREYKGKITEIALSATEKDKWARTGDQVNFSVRVEITDADLHIEPGMSTIVDIITAKANNVLTLPHEYIEKDNDKYYVTTEGGKKELITVGLENEDSFQILSGVRQGEQVRRVDFFNLPPQS